MRTDIDIRINGKWKGYINVSEELQNAIETILDSMCELQAEYIIENENDNNSK